MPERIVVIGGNAAGMTAASRAKRLDPTLEITVLEASPFISYSICGLPYYLYGLVERHEELISFTPEELLSRRGIRSRLRVRAEELRPAKRTVLCVDLESGREFELEYDRAVICTGYLPRAAGIEGDQLDNVLTVSRLEDGLHIRHRVETQKLRRVAVIGGGYIGLMMTHGLRTLGLEVLLLERRSHVFRQVEPVLAEIIQEELRCQGVRLVLDCPIRRLQGEHGVLKGVEVEGQMEEVDLALLDVGVRPNADLALASGIPCGVSGAIQVDERGQTAVAGIYAAGNCAETRHLVSGKPIYSTLGTTAARQGRVVGENLAGRRSRFPGTLETSVEKVFDLCVARTGLTLSQAHRSGFQAATVFITHRDRAGYYPGSRELHVVLVFEKESGRLLGGQMVGGDSAGKRIDTLVAALTAGLSLQDLARLDLAYAPPFGTLWDPLQVAAHVGLRQVES